MAAVEYAPEVFDEMPIQAESVVMSPIPSLGSPYSCVQELAKHNFDGSELQGQVSKHVEVHHGNQASAGQRHAEERGRRE
jgi:hypothetical protein